LGRAYTLSRSTPDATGRTQSDEADKLEHVISEEFEDKIDSLLGYPTVDPHGDPIPSKDGIVSARSGRSLLELQHGQSARILRVNDQDAEKLRYLGLLGLYPNVTIQLIEQAPFDGPLRLLIGDAPHQVEQQVGATLAEHIIVTP
jgi:DtxR family transcriptional regulator, Mn-dependent transcriptional regulator